MRHTFSAYDHICIFLKRSKPPHLSNSASASRQLEEMWSHNNPRGLIYTWCIITDPIKAQLASVKLFSFYNSTQHLWEVLKWITFVQVVKLLASESSPGKKKTLMVSGEFPVEQPFKFLLSKLMPGFSHPYAHMYQKTWSTETPQWRTLKC